MMLFPSFPGPNLRKKILEKDGSRKCLQVRVIIQFFLKFLGQACSDGLDGTTNGIDRFNKLNVEKAQACSKILDETNGFDGFNGTHSQTGLGLSNADKSNAGEYHSIIPKNCNNKKKMLFHLIPWTKSA